MVNLHKNVIKVWNARGGGVVISNY